MNTIGTVPQRTEHAAAARTASSAILIVFFALLTAIGAQISIPAFPVPFTLQTFFVLLSGALLGARRGALSQVVYVISGAAGAPVFAGFKGSILHLLGPTGGYLIAFPVAALLVGYLLHNTPLAKRMPVFAAALGSMILAMAVIFLAGVTQLNVIVFHNWTASLAAGFIHLQIWDAVKILAAATVYAQLGRRFSS
jgi:biotin transport system substrate-specific component